MPGADAVAHAVSRKRIVKLRRLMGGGFTPSDGTPAASIGAVASATVLIPEEIGSDFSPSMSDSSFTASAKARKALLKR
jgi:hypothetical protein